MLSEPQIQRYARQILLREVGGTGQERLLMYVVEVEGTGPTLSAAISYLVAGGTPVRAGQGTELTGFVAELTREALALDASPTDAVRCVLQVDAGQSLEHGERVLIGKTGVLSAAADACLACVAANRGTLSGAPVDDSPHLVLGALAALAVQRRALAIASAIELVTFATALATPPLAHCQHHGP